jgi:hypothetical protein
VPDDAPTCWAGDVPGVGAGVVGRAGRGAVPGVGGSRTAELEASGGAPLIVAAGRAVCLPLTAKRFCTVSLKNRKMSEASSSFILYASSSEVFAKNQAWIAASSIGPNPSCVCHVTTSRPSAPRTTPARKPNRSSGKASLAWMFASSVLQMQASVVHGAAGWSIGGSGAPYILGPGIEAGGASRIVAAGRAAGQTRAGIRCGTVPLRPGGGRRRTSARAAWERTWGRSGHWSSALLN